MNSSVRTPVLSLAIVFALSCIAALLVALAPASIAMLEGRYIPVSTDSWYHARRILDMMAEPSSFHEFDRAIHVPEGSLLIWPWGYDYLMSLIARAGLALHMSDDPIAILDHVPVVAFLLTQALVLVICRQLTLSVPATAMVLFATAFFPLNQGLYAVGRIDHHFAEHILVMASIAAGLGWQRKPESTARACCAGLVLGIAPAIHNGLFILQIPFVLGFSWAWVRGTPTPRNAWAFAVVLFVSTLAVAAGSTAFRQGAFEFYILSWFHVYVAACVGALVMFTSRVAYSPKQLVMLAAAGCILAIPIVSQALLGERFLSAEVEGMSSIAETASFWEIAQHGKNLGAMYQYGTGLLFLLPLIAALCLWRLWREPQRAVFWVACLVGLALLLSLVRLHNFGSFALYLPLILLVDERARRVARVSPTLVYAAAGASLLLCYAPGLRFILITKKITANDPYFALTYDVYADLTRECDKQPGVVLTLLDDAHYVRYYSKCSVIGNPFLITEQHVRKQLETRALFALPPDQFAERAPNVRYLFVRRSSLFLRDGKEGLKFRPEGFEQTPDPRLVDDLLKARPDQFPPGFRLLKELAFEKPAHVPYARVFAIDRAP